MPQRDINEIRTEKIAVRCDTAGEFHSILTMLDCEQKRKKDMVGMFPTYPIISFCDDNIVMSMFLHKRYEVNPASDYLTTTPAKYSAEEIKLMDEIAIAVTISGVNPEYAYEQAEKAILNRRKIIG